MWIELSIEFKIPKFQFLIYTCSIIWYMTGTVSYGKKAT